MNRRGFMGTMLALGAAPAIVRADSLMRIVPREAGIFVPSLMDRYESGTCAEGTYVRIGNIVTISARMEIVTRNVVTAEEFRLARPPQGIVKFCS